MTRFNNYEHGDWGEENITTFIKELKKRWREECNGMHIMSGGVAIFELEMLIDDITNNIPRQTKPSKGKEQVSNLLSDANCGVERDKTVSDFNLTTNCGKIPEVDE